MVLSATAFRFSYFRLRPLPSQVLHNNSFQFYSSKSRDSEDDLEDARKWYSTFSRQSLPQSVATTTYSRASGPGGQKTNKYVLLWNVLIQTFCSRIKELVVKQIPYGHLVHSRSTSQRSFSQSLSPHDTP